ncbi:hypothetical protein PSV08DRAFT_378273 [Bipolaris maydis]|nr:hypothetical protein J3E73DRAFT_399049 [Bipolaris maydis]KAJ6268224.1 hypothetical protein PSV08DRAFT_378273 [Bipolaris maydis]
MRRLSGLFSGPKTSFQVLSDLHLDHESQYLTFHIPVAAPYLVLAGNIGRLIDYEQYLAFLIRRCNLYEKVYLVLGALEFHGVGWMEGLQLAHRLEKEPATQGRLEILYETRSDIPGTNITLLGCTLWSQIPKSDASAALRKMPEFDEVDGIQDWSVEKHNAEHERDLQWLVDELKNPSAGESSLAPGTSASRHQRQLIVVTAFAADLRGCLEPWQVDAPWASSYGTNLLDNPSFSAVKMWISGATGRTCEFKKGQTIVVSNQRGRVGEHVTGALKDGLSEKQKVGLFDVMRIFSTPRLATPSPTLFNSTAPSILTAEMTDDTITLTASCLCKAHVHTTTIPKSSLPLKAHICHCDTCRHVSGSLYSSLAFWPSPRSTVDLSGYKLFNFSPAFDLLFCATCSTPMIGAFKDETKPLLMATGALNNVACDMEVVKWSHMGFIGDTRDGGASIWMKYINASGPPLKCFKTQTRGDGAEELADDWQLQLESPDKFTERQDAIPIRCKCRGVDLVLNRGNYDHVAPENLPWNVDPTSRKLKAELCGCDSCRLHTGNDVFYWTFVDLQHISFPVSADENEFPSNTQDLAALVDSKDARIGPLVYYESSPGVHRYFCSTCSTTIFYTVSTRPRFIDVAVGTLEAKDGARADSILAWQFDYGVGHKEDGAGGWREGLFEKIEKSLKEYGRTRSSSG